MVDVTISFKEARWYQQELIDWFRPVSTGGKGKKKAVCIWARKSGKDRVATFIESDMAFERPGLYWHALPKYEDARKVIWDAIMPNGQRLVEWAFPRQVCKHLDHEMKVIIPTPNGGKSIWQPVGADNYDGLVGAFPVHITWSEYALMSPMARNFLRPALAMADGSELIITTPRGYNHAYDLWNDAQDKPDIWYSSLLTAEQSGAISAEALAEERRTMPDEMYRQEYECSWSSANVGAILGRYVENAEKEGRISDDVVYDDNGAPVEISCDLGRRHISAFWFWQPMVDGFTLFDYDEDNGLDAEEWIERIGKRLGGRKLGCIWLPHDARAKTFSAKHSAVEQFVKAFGSDKVRVVPQSKLKGHAINAGQVVMRRCRFAKTACADGLAALRSWSYKYDEVLRQYSREPQQDWACDAADAFCEGAKIMQEREIKPKGEKKQAVLMAGEGSTYTMNDAWADRERSLRRGRFGARI